MEDQAKYEAEDELIYRPKAAAAWERCQRGRLPITHEERLTFLTAQHYCILPRDPEHNVWQWVEDGFPILGGVPTRT